MPALNPTGFRQFCENVGDETAVMIIDDYVTDSKRLLDDLRVALKASDYTSARRAAHTLRSTSLLFGAEEAATALGDVEDLCADGAAQSAVAKKVTAAAKLVDAARKALAKERKKLGG